MPIEREMQGKQINNTEYTFAKLYEQLLTTKLMGNLGVIAHAFNHRGTGRCTSFSLTPAWPV